ncbi:energy transducer TonB [Nevskia sp.]|uniref:energy transducer TonB n=1 Tax=Nevskia sp. TaxID=1929292 RepID=UPI0025EA1615|nr:energy transducer TonB [Nevskia sp.]
MAVTASAYEAGQRMSRRGRLIAAFAVIGLHVGGLAALVVAKAPAPPPEPVVMQVRMIAEAPVVLVEPPPPPPEPVKPKPQPRLVSTPKPTPSAIVTPPPDPEPVTEPVAEAPTPPAPPAPAAEPAIVPPNFVAAYLNNPPPVYPYAAKLRRETGEVRLRVLVLADGTAGDVRIEKSSGSTSLDTAARDVVFRKWRFVPAKRGDEAVDAWVIVPVLFELRR